MKHKNKCFSLYCLWKKKRFHSTTCLQGLDLFSDKKLNQPSHLVKLAVNMINCCVPLNVEVKPQENSCTKITHRFKHSRLCSYRLMPRGTRKHLYIFYASYHQSLQEYTLGMHKHRHACDFGYHVVLFFPFPSLFLCGSDLSVRWGS